LNLELAQRKFNDVEKASAVARDARRSCDEKLSEASRAVDRVESELSIVSSKLHGLNVNSSVRKKDKEDLEIELVELGKVFRSLGDLESMRHFLEEHRTTVDKSRLLMVEKRAIFDQARRDLDTRLERITQLVADLKNWDQRLGLANESVIELDKRKMIAIKELEVAELLPNTLLKRRESLIKILTEADLKKVEAADILSKKEAEFRALVAKERDIGRKASELREDAARASALKENTELNLGELRRSIKEHASYEPEDLLKTLPVELMSIPNVLEIETKLHNFKNKRDALGAVNLRAEEDSKELSEECNSLFVEKEDLKNAIKKLRAAIIKLNSEGRSRLLEAFQEVNRNFGELFKSLFGGGVAELTFIESDDPLDAGLEIMCQPPGKKLATLSLLSGGEQTLTALALIFSVFKANPSPICVLDEVDAPLDDANVERFCGLLDEMTRTSDTRFMIITHHPLSMSRMNRLYGITMVERGVSQLVSVDLEKAEELLEI
jgi:chromosome segregation protein